MRNWRGWGRGSEGKGKGGASSLEILTERKSALQSSERAGQTLTWRRVYRGLECDSSVDGLDDNSDR